MTVNAYTHFLAYLFSRSPHYLGNDIGGKFFLILHYILSQNRKIFTAIIVLSFPLTFSIPACTSPYSFFPTFFLLRECMIRLFYFAERILYSFV